MYWKKTLSGILTNLEHYAFKTMTLREAQKAFMVQNSKHRTMMGLFDRRVSYAVTMAMIKIKLGPKK